MKCPKCGAFVELEIMKFTYQEGRNIGAQKIYECEKGHLFNKVVKLRRKRNEEIVSASEMSSLAQDK